MPLALAADQTGILPDHMIAALARDGAIRPAYDFAPDQIQPASLDLRLGDVAWPLRCSFLPDSHSTVKDRIDDLAFDEIEIHRGVTLETNRPYLPPRLDRSL